MKINKFIWDNYKNSEQGKTIIDLFNTGEEEDDDKIISIINNFSTNNIEQIIEEQINLTINLLDFWKIPKQFIGKEEIQSSELIKSILNDGLILKYEDGEEEILFDEYNEVYFLQYIEEISFWLYLKFNEYFFPYFFSQNFRLLKKICDTFEIILPEIPKKSDKFGRAYYYLELCEVFAKFSKENNFTGKEFCAFLYDFAPSFIGEEKELDLPPATQVWMVGGNQSGLDLEFLENFKNDSKSFWQGNLDTKKGDIIVMYCLAPISSIHSIWRATEDGIADPFFHFYGSTQIGFPKKIPNIKLTNLKLHHYFKDNPKVRANMQGVNGYNLSNNDYQELLKLLNEEKKFNINELPQLYKPDFNLNINLKNEREVEISLVEPLIEKLGYNQNDWKRQVAVRMGRGERNYPDYVFFPNLEKGYESGKMLIEAKYEIKKNLELEDTFVQASSYALRLQSECVIICDKNALWIYVKNEKGFDRTNYTKKYWKQLEDIDDFNEILKLIGKKYIQ